VTSNKLTQPAPRFIGSHSTISHTPKLRTEKKTYSYNENPESLCYEQNHRNVLQRRIFIFGAQGYFKLEAHLEGLRRLMSYKLALHVLHSLNKWFQFRNILLYS